jgi:hypothetical protein
VIASARRGLVAAAERRRPAGLLYSRSPQNLTDEGRAELLRELRGLIAADHSR